MAISSRTSPIGPLVVKALRPLREETGAWLDVHLMIEEPDRYLADFARAGAEVRKCLVNLRVELPHDSGVKAEQSLHDHELARPPQGRSGE